MTIRNIIIIIIIAAIGYFFSLYTRLGTTINFGKKSVINVHHDVKCFFKEPNCEENNITLFTLFMSGIYFMIGYKYPDYYITIFALSIGSQIFLQYMNPSFQSSFIVDPLANLTGYALGSIMAGK
jgi:hypothetical protein